MRSSQALLATLLALLPLSACSCDDDPQPGCTIDMDCESGERCAPAADGAEGGGTCVANPECITDDECVDDDPRKRCDIENQTFTCVFREGFADDCDASRPCAFGQFCSSLLGRCLDAEASRDCTRRAQCPTDQICDRAVNKCIPETGCYGDNFCENEEICDLVNHVCRSIAVECTSCLISGACEGGALCTVDTKECVGGEVTQTCRSGERCDPLGRCVQCTNSEECGSGLFCNVASGRCESNVQCADDPSQCPDSGDVTCVMCTLPQICDPRSKRCQAPATICENDIDCPGDQYCDLNQDPPVCAPRVPDCLDDLLDEPPNDRYADARLLEEAAGPDYEELKLCPGDIDWYRVQVPAGTYLTIDARFRHDDGDLDLQLFLEDGTTLVDESRSTNDNERVELQAGTDLTLLMRVFFAVPSINPQSYRLIVTRDASTTCADDAHEPDDSVGAAKPLVSDVPYAGRLCAADPDWYVLQNVPAGTHLHALLDFADSLGDLDLELYRAGQPQPLLAARSLDDDEEIDYDASYGGNYFLRVVGKAADENVYSLRVDLRANPAATCLDDRFEPNDLPSTSSSAFSILNTVVPDLTLCSGDEDWFEIELGPGEALTAEVGFLTGTDLELRLYEADPTLDPRSTPLRASVGTGPREFLGYRSLFGDDYLLRVHGQNQAQVSPYELRIDRLPPVVSCVPDEADLAGLGNSQLDAVDLLIPPTRLDERTICSGDEDWYRAILLGGFNNVLRLQYLEADARLDVEVFDGNGTSLGQSGGAGDSKQIGLSVQGQGVAIVFLRVFASVGFETPYNLTLDLVPIFSCAPDVTEPSESVAEASLVASSSVSPILLDGLTMCTSAISTSTGFGDEDWFELNPPEIGSRIEASVTHAQSDLFMELIGPTGVGRACLNAGNDRCYSDASGLEEHLAFTSTVAGPYYLRVSSIYSNPAVPLVPPDADTPYSLTVTYETPVNSAIAMAISWVFLAAPPAALNSSANTTTATTAAKPKKRRVEPETPPLKVLLAPTILDISDPRANLPELEAQTAAAFSGALHDSAMEIFAWRRFQVVAHDQAREAVATLSRSGECATTLCMRDVAFGLGATHVLSSRLGRSVKQSCAASISLYDLISGREVFRDRVEITPCSADSVLQAAIDLGRKAAEGPRAPVRVTLNLTPRALRGLDLPNIPDVAELATGTASVARTRHGFPLERALEIYRDQHMYAFEDSSHPGAFYVARHEKLVNECEVRKAAAAPLSDDMRKFCDGNAWEWAWAGVPVGVLIAGLGADNFVQGDGASAFLFGAATAAVSATLALILNEDAVDVEQGQHYSDRTELEKIIQANNESLRQSLDLTPAEVEVAGMRR